LSGKAKKERIILVSTMSSDQYTMKSVSMHLVHTRFLDFILDFLMSDKGQSWMKREFKAGTRSLPR
jgi:hypothetical protein